MKKLVLLFVALGISLSAVTLYFFFRSETVDLAISEFESGDYVESIEILNRLAARSEYDAGEKIYYYRARSISSLAKKLEEKYSDELTDAALEKKGTPGYEKSKRKIEEKLESYNRRLFSDLVFVPLRKKGSIVPRGKFLEEFISKYRGSSLIEDIEFEEITKSSPEPEKRAAAMVAYYKKYPNTPNISQIVKFIFDSMRSGEVNIAGMEDILLDMIASYARKYPSSPEAGKIFRSKGESVNMRNSPGVDGGLVGKIRKDEIVIQLEKSMDKQQVGDIRDYWYRVATLKGVSGWIFGKFLKNVDLSEFKEKGAKEKWSLDENFSDWEDSNTPKNWAHMDATDKSSIGFSAKTDKKTAILKSAKGASAGLYTRYSASRAFTIQSRGRFVSGGYAVFFAYMLSPGKGFYLASSGDEIDICGRKIPLRTTDRHDYTLESKDGELASLYVDGELLSARIPVVQIKGFSQRGVYILQASGENEVSAEMDFIKIR